MGLKFVRPKTQTINNVLKTAINLKQISIRNKCLMKLDETRKLTANLLKSCKLLEYIEFIDKGNIIGDALNGIENGLFETKELERKSLKILIKAMCVNITKSILTISKIIH